MANAETNIKNNILLALGQRPDVYIQNSPTGTFRAMDNPERLVKIGNPGQSDLLAVVEVTITPDMVGRKIGVACFMEVKTATGKQRDNQRLFQYAVERRGGKYGLVRSPDEAAQFVQKIQSGTR